MRVQEQEQEEGYSLCVLQSGRGYDITFKSPQDAQPPLRNHDALSFDHLVLFAPTTKSEQERVDSVAE